MKKVKFLLLVTVLFLLGMAVLYSQEVNISHPKSLVVDAGHDTAICCTNPYVDTFYLGGSPTADFGTPPYLYSWRGVVPILNGALNVSYAISDTTAANPYLTECLMDATFYVTVTDNTGLTKTDSVVVRFSSFSFLLGSLILIDLGDTATLYSIVFGGIAPLQYNWEPNFNISDQSVENPLVWPDTTTTYFCTYTDSIGCTETMDYTVYVNTDGVSELEKERELCLLYPNPAHNVLQIKTQNGILEYLEIYTSTGQRWQTIQVGKNQESIDVYHLLPGAYFVRAVSKKEVFVKKFVVER